MIRRLRQSDPPVLEKILRKTEEFNEEEIKVALELIDTVNTKPEQNDYNIFVYEADKKILGYHCTGRRPMTDGVFDLYWIVKDPNSKKKGVGKKLIEHAEEFVKKKNGRWILAETSSRSIYEKTRNFYLRNNYSIVAEINDFYSIGDSLLIFGKYLHK